jgi:hypothetical protein
MPMPKAGYWADRSDTSYAGKMYRCVKGTCRGAKSSHVFDDDTDDAVTRRLSAATHSATGCWLLSNYTLDSHPCKTSSIQCTDGATGPLCGYVAVSAASRAVSRIDVL